MLPLKPTKGGFLRAFGCGWFIREFLSGHSPFNSPVIDPVIGAPQADIFYRYKNALRSATAYDRATGTEEKRARREKRAISPENIDNLARRYLERMPYKGFRARYHSFVVYFSNLQRLGWVGQSGKQEPSSFQDNYPPGPPRKYYRLTEAGRKAGDMDWANPRVALYGRS
jgi:hypothetical protein